MISDDDVLTLRDQLYALAETATRLARVPLGADFAAAVTGLTVKIRGDVESDTAAPVSAGKLSRSQTAAPENTGGGGGTHD